MRHMSGNPILNVTRTRSSGRPLGMIVLDKFTRHRLLRPMGLAETRSHDVHIFSVYVYIYIEYI